MRSSGTGYSWTFGNRLSGVSRPGSTATYAYDGEDRRTTKISNGVMTRTLWSGADEVADYDASGALLRRFIPDDTGAMDARLAVLEANGTIYWLHVDHQGSVIATSNAAGQALQFVNYSPYGEFGTDADGNALTAPPVGASLPRAQGLLGGRAMRRSVSGTTCSSRASRLVSLAARSGPIPSAEFSATTNAVAGQRSLSGG
jgi:YD repeat-containing protein